MQIKWINIYYTLVTVVGEYFLYKKDVTPKSKMQDSK